MSEERNIDYETFSKTRGQRFQEWRHGVAHRFREWRRDLVGRFTQRGWLETEAEVTSCKAVPARYSGYSWPSRGSCLSGWAVGFTYVVNGRSFDGILMARDEVERHKKFTIRYNPARPDENDTLATKLDWIDGAVIGVYDVLLAVLLGALIVAGIVLRR